MQPTMNTEPCSPDGVMSAPPPARPPRRADSSGGPVKALKRFVKAKLYRFCELLEALSRYIQNDVLRMTLVRHRAEWYMAQPLSEMDQDLLAVFIRRQGHAVEKAVRNPRSSGPPRGAQKAVLVRSALDEWYRRGYPRRAFTEWAEENLVDFEKWVQSGTPQMHPGKDLPVFGPQSPVWEVLHNRVSTRFWEPRPVEEEKLQAILEAATYAPTGCNRQAWKLYVRRNPILPDNARDSGTTNSNLRTKAPVVIYITIDERMYPEIWGPAEDAGIMGLQLSLAATSLGLAGCLMYGAEMFNQAAFCREFGVPKYRVMYLMYLFGYAAERTVTTKRAHPDDVAIFV